MRSTFLKCFFNKPTFGIDSFRNLEKKKKAVERVNEQLHKLEVMATDKVRHALF